MGEKHRAALATTLDEADKALKGLAEQEARADAAEKALRHEREEKERMVKRLAGADEKLTDLTKENRRLSSENQRLESEVS